MTSSLVRDMMTTEVVTVKRSTPFKEIAITFDKVGLYHGQCTQFCGLAHADMVFRVRVVNQAEYRQWLATAVRAGTPGQPGR
jgi:hypothetical protein